MFLGPPNLQLIVSTHVVKFTREATGVGPCCRIPSSNAPLHTLLCSFSLKISDPQFCGKFATNMMILSPTWLIIPSHDFHFKQALVTHTVVHKNYLTDLPFGWPIVPMQRDLVNQELHLPIITLKMPWGRIPATIDSGHTNYINHRTTLTLAHKMDHMTPLNQWVSHDSIVEGIPLANLIPSLIHTFRASLYRVVYTVHTCSKWSSCIMGWHWHIYYAAECFEMSSLTPNFSGCQNWSMFQSMKEPTWYKLL